MNIDRVTLKADAKAAIRESKTSPYLTALIYSLIVYLLGYLQSNITGITINYESLITALDSGNYDYLYYLVQEQQPGAIAELIGTLLSLMSRMLMIGFTIFALQVSRRGSTSVGNLFDGFGNFFRFLWLLILMWIFTFLWSLLLVVPGIIAAYRYRQAIYILIDNPKMRPIDCIRKSKELMKGHKSELFVLDLSFLGWYLLIILPSLFSNIAYYVYIIMAVSVSTFIYPYINVTYAGYYDALMNVERGYYQRPSSGPSGPSSGPTGYAADKKDELPPWEFKD